MSTHMKITVIDFDTLSCGERKRILRESIVDMDRLAAKRKAEGMTLRAWFLQLNNVQQIERLHHGNE